MDVLSAFKEFCTVAIIKNLWDVCNYFAPPRVICTLPDGRQLMQVEIDGKDRILSLSNCTTENHKLCISRHTSESKLKFNRSAHACVI